MVRLTRSIEFATSLRYWRGDCSPEENEKLFGPWSRKHGHNYRLEVTVQGEPDPETGMVMNLTDLKAILEREIMSRFDHRDLNEDSDFFEKVPPTPENFALVIHRILSDALPAGLLGRVRLHQDSTLFVDVTGDAG